MFLAMESALKSSTRWIVIGLGLSACLLDLGCARLRTARQGGAPLLGTAAPFATSAGNSAGSNDFYAQQVHKGVSESRSMLAQDRARANRKRGVAASPEKEESLAQSTEVAPVLAPALAHEADERVASRESSTHEADERVASRESSEDKPLDVGLEAPITIPPLRTAKPALASASTRAVAKPEAAPEPDRPAPPKVDPLRTVLADSRETLNGLTSYQVMISRQERVGRDLQAAEDLLLSIRREPRAVRLEWPAGAHKGREVIYSASETKGMMHVNMADSIVPMPPLTFAPDSPVALRSSRHPITEAGFDAILEKMEKAVEGQDAHDPSFGKVTYAGQENPGQLERPAHKVVRVMPNGETWLVYLDSQTKLPVLVQANAANGDLLERYLFRSPRTNVADLASADAFDPSKRWGSSGAAGLLQRFARAGSSKPNAESTTR